MSPHVEYWGIPSPLEEFSCTLETDSPVDHGETALPSGSQFFVQSIECSEKRADSVPRRSNRPVPFLERNWRDRI
jgi:hypothetical protein